MRKKIVAANWKMNLTLKEGNDLVDNILAGLPAISQNRQVVIAAPFVHTTQTVAQLRGKEHIYAGAQNCHTENSGAYTGEISAAMLKDAGVTYVITGHSERRQYFNEDSAMLAKKVNQGLANGYWPHSVIGTSTGDPCPHTQRHCWPIWRRRRCKHLLTIRWKL